MDAGLKKVLTGEEGGSVQAGGAMEGGHAAESSPKDEKEAAVPDTTPTDDAESHLIWLFHLLMALAGAYMAMAITNWGSTDGTPDAYSGTTVGTESMWLKIVAQWLTMILYIWSLWAPVCRGETAD